MTAGHPRGADGQGTVRRLSPEGAAFSLPEEEPGNESQSEATDMGLPGDVRRDYQGSDDHHYPEINRYHEPYQHLESGPHHSQRTHSGI